MALFSTRRSSAAVFTAVAAVAASGLAGSQYAAAAPASLSLNYTCDYPLVLEQPLKVKINADVPTSIAAGQPSPSIHVDTKSTINADTTNGLAMIGAASIEGTATSTSTVHSPAGAQDVQVPITLTKRSAPSSGDFEVEGSGDAPRVTLAQPGQGSITVGKLVLHITARDSSGAPITDPDLSNIPCTLDSGQDATLATFTVTDGGGGGGGGDTTPPTAPGKPTVTATTADSATLSWTESTDDTGVDGYDVYNGDTKLASSKEPGVQVTGLKPETEYTLTVRARDAAGNNSSPSPAVTFTTGKGSDGGDKKPPAGCSDWKGSGKYPAGSAMCVFLAGYSNVQKLGAAVAVNDPANGEPTFAHAVLHSSYPSTGHYLVELKFAGPLRAQASTLQFGFMPVRANMEMTQVGESVAKIVQDGKNYTIRAETDMSIRLFDVTVNGTKLDVGPKCRSVTPAKLLLGGGSPEFTNVLKGGPLRGKYTLPKFTGCGTKGDNLDRLLSASISGPDNYIKMIEGNLCSAGSAECLRPSPQR
ncbi:fibronectin type III domain-containing protein [Actinomadura atramentaria]|uniref:fibronectin type III domain-containing protein n=1 Tax=Actinomadura atramentaria TaxID=1990 RepID=UPI00035C9CAA|nr:fibronectin type III domain-containing protein [Actinomadura atramentaria]